MSLNIWSKLPDVWMPESIEKYAGFKCCQVDQNYIAIFGGKRLKPRDTCNREVKLLKIQDEEHAWATPTVDALECLPAHTQLFSSSHNGQGSIAILL